MVVRLLSVACRLQFLCQSSYIVRIFGLSGPDPMSEELFRYLVGLRGTDPGAEAVRILTDAVTDAPLLVRTKGYPQRLAGIVTAFDLL